MTVPATTQGRAAYYGDGATKEFVIPFLFYNNSDGTAGLRVSTSDLDGGNPTVLTYETDYTLTNEGAPAGTLTLAQPLPANRRIVVVYDLAFEQETSLSDFSRMPAQLIEKAMNRLTLELIQLREIVDRCVKEGVESTTDPNVVIEKINVLYSHIGELQTVAADIANIDAVSNDKTAIDALAAITGVLNTLNTNIEALITDAKNIATINTVAGAEAELLALHGKLAELVAVYGKLPQVQTVSDAVNDVVMCAAEIAAIKDAPNQAAAASASASAALASQQQSAVSQTEAKQSELKAAAYAERVRSEGIPMSIIEQKRISIDADGRTVRLWWKDPRDTIIDGYVIASWDATVIVKKQGAYPEDIDDGVIVATVTDRDSHLDDALTDEQENAAAWKYRAFPRSANGVYCLDKRNCFGVWVYGYYIDEAAPVTSTRVHKIEGCDNYFYERAYMDFENNRFEWGDWRNAPFLPRPCMLKRSGEVAYYLDPDNF